CVHSQGVQRSVRGTFWRIDSVDSRLPSLATLNALVTSRRDTEMCVWISLSPQLSLTVRATLITNHGATKAQRVEILRASIVARGLPDRIRPSCRTPSKSDRVRGLRPSGSRRRPACPRTRAEPYTHES